MERRDFLKFAVGLVDGAATLAASAQAAPLPPVAAPKGADREGAEPAVVSQADVDRLKPEEVRWGHHGHWHRHHGWWHRRHWHRRHWRGRY
ncbi:MAG TPA: twin-arginine translocation signal domain-containing protein [Bradyrhizobium sp.]|nr:twin-arginine translocation signal domain-containing protein [Bradyrhizobium sp.]